MSEYQYYEFQAIDRPLGQADLEAPRALSMRARITAMSFTDTYEWGNFKGSNSAVLMERWFDLYFYLSCCRACGPLLQLHLAWRIAQLVERCNGCHRCAPVRVQHAQCFDLPERQR